VSGNGSTLDPEELAALAERYRAVRQRIPAHVTLVAVSKLRSAAEVKALYDLGHRDFGENYMQELRVKQAQLPADIRWHFIGHLQRSNARHAVSLAHLIHGVDGEALLAKLQKRAASAGMAVRVLLQVHIAQEETKHGLTAAEARMLVGDASAGRWPNLLIKGLMGLATHTADQGTVRAEFEGLSDLFGGLRQAGGPEWDTLSMGMSGDAEVAIGAGSTLVRIGTAIFGERQPA
jgi:hypothetical protein